MNGLISVCMYWYLSFFTPQVLGVVKDTIESVASVFEDWKESVRELVKETAVNMVSGTIEQMIDLLTNGLTSSTGETSPVHVIGEETSGNVGIYSIVKDLMLYHPKTYNDTIWGNIITVSTDVIVPIATTLIAIIAVYDLYQMVVMGNGMHDFDSSIFIRWVVKTDIAITLTSNAFSITSWIFQFGSDISFATVGGDANWLSGMLSGVKTGDALKESLMKYETGELFVVFFISVLTLAAIFFMLAAIIIGLMGRLIEMYMYLSISPIAVSTLMNNETKGIGDSWIRGAMGLSFQVFFIIIALTIFGSLFNSAMGQIVAGTNIIWNMLILCAYAVTLIFTILRSGQISKGMFGAH